MVKMGRLRQFYILSLTSMSELILLNDKGRVSNIMIELKRIC